MSLTDCLLSADRQQVQDSGPGMGGDCRSSGPGHQGRNHRNLLPRAGLLPSAARLRPGDNCEPLSLLWPAPPWQQMSRRRHACTSQAVSDNGKSTAVHDTYVPHLTCFWQSCRVIAGTNRLRHICLLYRTVLEGPVAKSCMLRSLLRRAGVQFSSQLHVHCRHAAPGVRGIAAWQCDAAHSARNTVERSPGAPWHLSLCKLLQTQMRQHLALRGSGQVLAHLLTEPERLLQQHRISLWFPGSG